MADAPSRRAMAKGPKQRVEMRFSELREVLAAVRKPLVA